VNYDHRRVIIETLESERERSLAIEQCAERLLEALDQRFPMPIRRDTVAREMLALRAAISGAHEEN
jgi:hypothetical protein